MSSIQISDLEGNLTAAAAGTPAEIDALNNLAAELMEEYSERAQQLAQRALELCRSGILSEENFAGRAAASLSILGRIANLRCEFNAALPNLLEAQTLLEKSGDFLTWDRVLCGLGWTYFNLGDFPLAIEYLQRANKLCRDNANRLLEATVLNLLGAVYGESGEKQESIDSLQRALDYLDGTENLSLVSRVLNNLAMTQMEIADYPEAIKNASESLRLAQILDSAQLLAPALDTIGQIHLAQKNFALAEDFFKRARAIYQGEGMDPDEFTLNLAQAAIGQGRLDEAARLLTDSIATVESSEKNRFAYRFHELLAQIYEQQGQIKKSIHHYKRFRALKSRFFNEETQRRMSNLLVMQQAETSQIDAEIHRLKNLALRQEVAAHQQAVAEMEVLATTDSLTGLLNRRHFMTLANYSFETARKTNRPLAAMMMDLDDFKQVNDTFGHLAGDRVLAEVSAAIQASLRSEDLLGRYGGEEFSAVFPDTDLRTAQKLAERILGSIAGHITRHGNHAIQITISIGTAAFAPCDADLKALLERADQALYEAKGAGKNQVKINLPPGLPPQGLSQTNSTAEDEWNQIG